MNILIVVPDNYAPEDGTAFDAVQSALEHFNIPSTMRQVSDTVALQAAVEDPDVTVAEALLKKVSNMSTDELDAWYVNNVGYSPSGEDPALVGNPEHVYLVAEMMCLHTHGAEGPYVELCRILSERRVAGT